MNHATLVKNLFEQVCDLPAGERAAWLEQACPDAAVRDEVLALLRSLDAAAGFLAPPSQAPATEQPGTVIDRYRLVSRLGEGGFGVVWRAEQTAPMRREVALKVIKLGMDTRAVVARFEQERQALARMQHPNIAAVFDGGTTPSGRPYFAMELVAGVPITDYCREHGLGIGERVALLHQVCLGVQHAHQKGLVHRDIKPANILVARVGETPVPKIIDFGIAKAVVGDDERDATLTREGQFVGTLEYMAPEQAAADAGVDSRADVYGLGVLLYELLTGRRPFERSDPPGGGVAALMARIQQDDVRRPSSVVAAAGAVAALPGADAQRWSRRLRGDLDWVLQKALAKDPAERYPTASALADELQRFLESRPVEVGPPTATYRLRRFVSRHRLAVTSALVLVASLVAGAVGTLTALDEARAEARRRQAAEDDLRQSLKVAEAEAELRKTALEASRELLFAANPTHLKGRDYTVREQLDDFAASIGRLYGDQPAVAGELHMVVGMAYRELGLLELAEEHLAAALAQIEREPQASTEVLEGRLFEWAWLRREQARYDEVAAALERAMALASARDPGGDSTRRIMGAQADLARLQGDVDESVRLASIVRDRLMAAPRTVENKGAMAQCLEVLGACAGVRGQRELELDLHRQVLQLRLDTLPADHPMVGISWSNIAVAEKRRGNIEAAIDAGEQCLAIYRGAYGDDHLMVADALSQLSGMRRKAGQLEVARGLAEEALAIRRRHLPENHQAIAISDTDLGMIAMSEKDHEVAVLHLSRALAIEEAVGGAAFDRAALLQNLGVVYSRMGRPAKSEECNRRALELHLSSRGEAHASVADTMQNIGIDLAAQGRYAEAAEMHRKALALKRQHQPDEVDRQLQSLSGLAAVCEAGGELREAAAAHLERVGLLSGADPTNQGQTKEGQTNQGATDQGQVEAIRLKAARLLLAAGDAAAAEPLIETSRTYCEGRWPGRWPVGDCMSLLARCRLAKGDVEGAMDLAESGWALMRGSRAPRDRRVEAATAVQDLHRRRAEALAAVDPPAAERHRQAAAAAAEDLRELRLEGEAQEKDDG